MMESGITLVPMILDSRQKRSAVRLANACSSTVKKLNEDPSSSTPICQLVETEHKHGRKTDGMSLATTGEEPVVITIIPDDKSTAMRAAQRRAREKNAKPERESEWGGQPCHALTTAECEHQQCASTVMNGGPPAVICLLGRLRDSTPSCG
jgi:hypothetical protein